MTLALQIKALIALVGTAGVVGAFIYLKNSFANWMQRKQERDSFEKTIEVIKDQRDTNIPSVAAADKLWDAYDKQ